MQYNNSNTPFKYGVIKNYNGLTGKIVTEDNTYYFTIDDILENQILNNDDWVRFNSKSDNFFPQAYYITKKVIIKTK